MSQEQVLLKLNKALTDATVAASVGDEDAWYLAMHKLRSVAWTGKELIHEKRMAAAPKPIQQARAILNARNAMSDLATLGISPSELLEALKKVNNEAQESPDANTLDVSSSTDG